MRRYAKSPFLLAVLCVFATGCVNGPVRYKALGFRKSATAELVQRSAVPLKPLAGLAGVPLDAVVCAGDTALDLVLMYPLTLTHGGPDARGCLYHPGVPAALECGVLSLIWWPATLLALQLWPEYMYSDIFGPSPGLFTGTSQVSVQHNKRLQLPGHQRGPTEVVPLGSQATSSMWTRCMGRQHRDRLCELDLNPVRLLD
jgi:hypothetical protein